MAISCLTTSSQLFELAFHCSSASFIHPTHILWAPRWRGHKRDEEGSGLKESEDGTRRINTCKPVRNSVTCNVQSWAEVGSAPLERGRWKVRRGDWGGLWGQPGDQEADHWGIRGREDTHTGVWTGLVMVAPMSLKGTFLLLQICFICKEKHLIIKFALIQWLPGRNATWPGEVDSTRHKV